MRKMKDKTKIFLSICFIVLVLLFLLNSFLVNRNYVIGDWKISKKEMDSLELNAMKDGVGRFRLCNIEDQKCILVGRIEK